MDESYNQAVRFLLVLALLAATLTGQTPPRAAFEVATLKRNPNCEMDPRSGPSPGRVELRCLPLRAYIRMAYGVFTGGSPNIRRVEVLGGPSWLDNERYDLSAKAAGPASTAEMMGPMLQALLEERLQLKTHTEPRETAVFELTVLPGKLKLEPIAEGACTPLELFAMPKPGDTTKYCGGGSQRMTADRTTIADWTGVTMDELANRMLSAIVERQVVNRTRLDGRYDIHVEFVRPARPGMVSINGQPAPAPTSDPAAGPSIFTALQSLGLKLTPGKAPLDVIVIDRVERPSEN